MYTRAHTYTHTNSKEDIQMANKDTKTCSTLTAIWEITMKITMRYHLKPTKMDKMLVRM